MSYDKNITAQRHLNANGSVAFLGIGEGADETKEREKTYNYAKQNWPADVKYTTCADLKMLMAGVQLGVDAAYQSKTLDDSKDNQKVNNRTIDGYTRWLNELKVMNTQKQCVELQEAAEEKEFFDTQYDNLERVQGLSDEAGNKTKYLIFGMLGVVVLISGYIILKKD